MKFRVLGCIGLLFAASVTANAQASVICGETGGSPWMTSSYVFGRVKLVDADRSKKFPNVAVTLSDRQGSNHRFTIDRAGGYCFRNVDGSGGTIVISIDGIEVARRSLPSAGPRQFQEDFEISTVQVNPNANANSPGVVESYPRSEKNAKLFDQGSIAEREKKFVAAADHFKTIVADDPADHISWFRLGAIYFDLGQMVLAENAFANAIKAKPEHVASLINLGRARLMQDKTGEAIEVLVQATKVNATNARAFQLLGEAYVVARNGGLAFDALKEAIRLDPVGRAECHLLLARLYDLGGARAHAASEYKQFLAKVPSHPDKKKFESYVKEHSPDDKK